MNKKTIILLALTCGVMCQDAGAKFGDRLKNAGKKVGNFGSNLGNKIGLGKRKAAVHVDDTHNVDQPQVEVHHAEP